MDRDTINPFELFDKSNRRINWSEELKEGIYEHWVKRFLLPALRNYQQDGYLRKCFVLAGSDAHMDFNYSFRPHPAFLIHNVYDNAFGKVRTLAYLRHSKGKHLTEENIYEAIKSGKTLLTDGPIALFYLRPNGSEEIYRLGDTLKLPRGGDVEIDIEWQSTSEFGPIKDLKLFLGTKNGEEDITDQIGAFKPIDTGEEFNGHITHTFRNWVADTVYMRMEASSGGSITAGGNLFYCVTNPIWITTE
jgi:hypothetical protein